MIFRQTGFGEGSISQNGSEQIVEIVRHAARQHPQTFPLPSFGEFPFHRFPFGHIAASYVDDKGISGGNSSTADFHGNGAVFSPIEKNFGGRCALSAASGQQFAQQLNDLSGNIQGLRKSADQQMGTDVQTANNTLDTIAQLNGQISQLQALGQSTATLEDQRDQAITDLAKLMDIRTVTNSANQVSVFTGTGLQLVGDQAAKLTFDNRGSLTATVPRSGPPTLDTHGDPLATLRAGLYDIVVRDASPRGGFFVEEGLALSRAEAGSPYALATSGRSNVLQEFDGGPGQIALHGTRHLSGSPGSSSNCVDEAGPRS